MSKRSSNLEKILDFHIGRIILIVFSIFKIKRKLPNQIRRIGIFKEAALGDTTLLSGIIRDIKDRYPGITLYFICSSSNVILGKNLIDEEHVYKIPIKNPAKSVLMIRKLKLDVLIDFGSWPRINALICLFAGAKFTIGFKTKGQYRHFCYDQVIEHSNGCHELDNYRNLCRLAKIESSSLPELHTTAQLPPEFKNRKFIIFHPWPSGFKSELRKWSDVNWKKLIDWSNENGYEVCFSGSPGEKELNDRLIGEQKAINLAGKYSFQELLIIIKNAQAVVSVNTGIMHIAAALNVPTIGLSGPTNDKRWGPLGEKSISIIPNVEGCGYLNLGFEYDGERIDCMEHILFETVVDALRRVLE